MINPYVDNCGYSWDTVITFLDTTSLINLSQVSKKNLELVQRVHPQPFAINEKLAYKIQTFCYKICQQIAEINREQEIASKKKYALSFLVNKLPTFVSTYFDDSISKKEKLQLRLELCQREIKILVDVPVKELEALHLEVLHKVHKVFGGIDRYYELPVLDINSFRNNAHDQFFGSCREYLDYFPAKMITSPAMRGIDFTNRHFFVLKNKQNKIQVFFQRYTGSLNEWSVAHNHELFDVNGYWIDRGEDKKETTEKLIEFVKTANSNE